MKIAIIVLSVLVLMALFFYPKKYNIGISVDESGRSRGWPNCLGIKIINEAKPGLSSVTCYGILTK